MQKKEIVSVLIFTLNNKRLFLKQFQNQQKLVQHIRQQFKISIIFEINMNFYSIQFKSHNKV